MLKILILVSDSNISHLITDRVYYIRIIYIKYMYIHTPFLTSSPKRHLRDPSVIAGAFKPSVRGHSPASLLHCNNIFRKKKLIPGKLIPSLSVGQP